ncbi:MAG: HIT domain-containing protein [Actinomycetota bacterium]
MTANLETLISPRDPDCLFCRIVIGDVPTNLVAENESAIAFRDIHPQAPVHILVTSRAHHPNVSTLVYHDPHALVALTALAAQVAVDHADGHYRLVFNTGAQAGQTVDHVHGHVLSGRALTWPPG